MTSESLRVGNISTQSIKDALFKAKGDIFVTAGILHCSPTEVDRYIRSDEELQVYVGSIDKVKIKAEYEKYSDEQFRQAIEQKSKHYKNIALDEIHALASIPIESDGERIGAALADVKLRAAIKLLGDTQNTPIMSDTQSILLELNRQYQQSAPRIKSIRVSQIEYDTTSSVDETSDASLVLQSDHES